MHGASCYYMRPTAIFFLLFASFTIIVSYCVVPRSIEPDSLEIYHHYWHLLAAMLGMVSVYLVFAFYVEDSERDIMFYHHMGAALGIVSICGIMMKAIQLALMVM